MGPGAEPWGTPLAPPHISKHIFFSAYSTKPGTFSRTSSPSVLTQTLALLALNANLTLARRLTLQTGARSHQSFTSEKRVKQQEAAESSRPIRNARTAEEERRRRWEGLLPTLRCACWCGRRASPNGGGAELRFLYLTHIHNASKQLNLPLARWGSEAICIPASARGGEAGRKGGGVRRLAKGGGRGGAEYRCEEDGFLKQTSPLISVSLVS